MQAFQTKLYPKKKFLGSAGHIPLQGLSLQGNIPAGLF